MLSGQQRRDLLVRQATYTHLKTPTIAGVETSVSAENASASETNEDIYNTLGANLEAAASMAALHRIGYTKGFQAGRLLAEFCEDYVPEPYFPMADTRPTAERLAWRIDHSSHGQGTEEDGPDDPDCPCRDTRQERACAQEGCGFCREEHE